MKKIYGIIVIIFILFIMAISLSLLKAIVDIYIQNNNLTQIEYILLGLVKLLPLFMAFILIKWSWKKITFETKTVDNKHLFSSSNALENVTKKEIAIKSLESKGYNVILKNDLYIITEPLGGKVKISSIEMLVEYAKSKNGNRSQG